MTIRYKFLRDESGAVTVDWVVLTAAIVGIAMAVIALLSTGVQNASNDTNDNIETASGNKFSNLVLGLEGTGVVNGDGVEIYRNADGKLSLGALGDPMQTVDFDGDIRDISYDSTFVDTPPVPWVQEGVPGTTFDRTTTVETITETYDSTLDGGNGGYDPVSTFESTTETIFVPDPPEEA